MFVEKKWTLPNQLNLDIKCTVNVDQNSLNNQPKSFYGQRHQYHEKSFSSHKYQENKSTHKK